MGTVFVAVLVFEVCIALPPNEHAIGKFVPHPVVSHPPVTSNCQQSQDIVRFLPLYA